VKHVYAQYHAVMCSLSSKSDKGSWDTLSLGFAEVGNQSAEGAKRLQPKTDWRLNVS